jgi:AraC-like DNA-binding protein
MKWTGRLALGDGWAFYRGVAGDNASHAHYAAQLICGRSSQASATVEGDSVTNKIIFIPSNTRHRLAARAEPIDILYAEPVLLQTNGGEKLSTERDCAVSLYEIIEQKLRFSANNIDPMLFGGYDDSRISAAIDLIEQGLDAPIRLKDLAFACNLSKSRFGELFRKTTELSLRQFVLWRRLRRAMLVIGAGETATFAAHEAGFSDAAHFSRTLRNMFGVAPRDLMSTVAIEDPLVS